MGLFSKKKEEANGDAILNEIPKPIDSPISEPLPPLEPKMEDVMPAPIAPPSSMPSIEEPVMAPPVDNFNAPTDMQQESSPNLDSPISYGHMNLSAPPIPGGLGEIKNQVTSPSENEMSNNNLNQMPMAQDLPETPNMEMPNFEVENNIQENHDDLFDFSDIDSQLSANSQNVSNNSNVELPNLENNSNDINNQTSKMNEEDNLNRNTNDVNLPEINFIEENAHSDKKVRDETYFVTTSQFKSLLEIVDGVKMKTKEATETHLKLMDIKAEEDLEFENLRKSFQYIEEKLYEVDSLIFDK